VEIAERAIDAINRRDLDAYDELFTADCEWFPAMPGIIEGDSFKGREGFADYAAEIADTWEESNIVVDEFRGRGNWVLILHRLEMRGRGGGVPVTARLTALLEFRDGKVSRLRTYFDHDEALRAAGLSE
jgi:ketosteroid isomerase-like protein